MRVRDFDFDLPEELIAQHPRPRGGSRLLVVDRASATWQESTMADLPRWLRAGDVLVANDSRVFPARLLGTRQPGGGRAECLLMQAPPTGEAVRDARLWALVSPGRRLPVDAVMHFTDHVRAPGVTLIGRVCEVDASGRRLVALVADGTTLADAIDRLGHMPLPPYIRRPDTADDRARYQTMFARHAGSIAAPTAGLHFDERLLGALDAAGIERTTVTLHVGYGTFKPVKVDQVSEHRVDAERWQISADAAATIVRARAAGRRTVAIGTTTTRTLESAVRLPGGIQPGFGDTDLCVTPGHEFRAVDALVTNFHLPRSSLLLLVSAFAGRDLVLAAYRDAVARRFSFYSYGDAMLIQ